CQIAWYIFHHYSSIGLNARLVGDSMGGDLVYYALWGVYNHEPAFPPYLYVPAALTFQSPLGGIPNVPVFAGWACHGCTQFSNLQQTMAGQAGHFINSLLSETSAPMGSPGMPTEWTLVGSACEIWTDPNPPPGAGGGQADAELKFPRSFSADYPAVHK